MELAEQLGVALSTTFHVKILKEAGLIKVLATLAKRQRKEYFN